MIKIFSKKDCENQHIELKFFGLKIKYKPKKKSVFYIGKHNTLKVIKADGTVIYNPNYIEGLTILFKGDNSLVELNEPYKFNDCKIQIGTDNKVKIGRTKHLINRAEFLIFRQKNNSVIIGENFSSESIVFDLGDEPDLSVQVGNDCMASHAILLRPSDAHAIKNADGKCINKGENIIIGNHVWIGFDVYFLKGSTVPDNCIIAARSTYTKNSYQGEELGIGGIFAGSPAKVVKSNVYWE